jgi:hypothetical protein
MAKTIRVAAIVLILASAKPGWAASDVVAFSSIPECIAKGRLKRALCTDAFKTALDIYRETAPRFKTRDACNLEFRVCVIFNPPGPRGEPPQRLSPGNLTFSPPLIAFGVSDAAGTVQALVDVTRHPLREAVPIQSYSKGAAAASGFGKGPVQPPTRAFSAPEADSPQADSAGSTDTAGAVLAAPIIDSPGKTSLEGVQSYPVPAYRRRNAKADRQ